jgi:hypothetical protein
LLVLATVCGLASSGCTRHFFRKEADKEVDEVLAEKDHYPQWRIDQFHVYPDPRSRFADPTNPDRPPMPPDDPAAWALAPHPQKPGHHKGIERQEGTGYLELLAAWDKQNREEAETEAKKQAEAKTAGKKDEKTPAAKTPAQPGTPEKLPSPPPQEPTTAGPLPAKPEVAKAKVGGAIETIATGLSSGPNTPRPYLLKLDQAVELGLINSREYQDAREDLYLTALPVTLERFAFTAQFFLAGEAIREYIGREAAGGATPSSASRGSQLVSGSNQDNWVLNSNFGFTKFFSTGALLLFSFANQTVLNVAGAGRDVTSQSTINLDLIQPLLRGGGRAVTLEPLTQAERNLVYEIRNYARFREEFYVAIAGGGGGSITGSAFQPTGVIAANTFSPAGGVGGSGLLPGVIPTVPINGEVPLQVNPGTSGRISLQTALAAPVSGYLSTLLQAAQIRIDQYNIDKLEQFLALARAMEEGGDISQLQVDQFEQQVLGGRSNLLTDQQQYLLSLDQFKLQLGVPTDLPLQLDDSPFRALNQQFQRYEDLFKEFDFASKDAPQAYKEPEMVPQVRRALMRIFTTAPITEGTQFRTRIESDWAVWEKLSDAELRKRLLALGEERRRLLDRKTDVEFRGQTLPAAEQQRLDRLTFEIDLGNFEAVMREYESQPWKNVLNAEVRRRQQQARYRYVNNAFILVLAEARNERVVQLRTRWPDPARLCLNGIDLLKADLDEAQAAVIQAGLTNRLDLMNVRGNVVDAWRQLAVFANALLGIFNVQYHMTSTTPAGRALPFAFSGSRTTHQLIFNGELPLVRKNERNNYRAALINYQRARRILQRAEDGVAFDLRNELRQLRQQEELYRIQQRQIELSYLTVENSLDTFQAPPAPMPAGAAGADTQTRAAALTNQLIMAQASLYRAQFTMTTIWITYLNTRLQLYRDMELMPLDNRGVWIDDIATCQCPDSNSQSPAGGSAGNGAGTQSVPKREE